jgi:hypothetical protein
MRLITTAVRIKKMSPAITEAAKIPDWAVTLYETLAIN